MKTTFLQFTLVSLSFLLLLPLFSTLATASEHGSPQTIIRDYLMASEMLKRCPAVEQDGRISGRREQIDNFGEILINSLASRALKLSPRLTRTTAAEQVRQWLQRQAAATSDAYLCNLATNAQLLEIIGSFRQLKTRFWLKSYGERTDIHIRPVPLQSNRRLKTYALPAFQRTAIASIVRFHSPVQCTQPFIEKIELIRKKRTETVNKPVYVMNALSFIERWEFSCIGRRYWVEVSFSRNNDGMIGSSSISGN
nr:hypothetical protein [uncultured Cohaesibacter sp.]